MEIVFKKKDFEFLKTLKNKELTLKEIGLKLGMIKQYTQGIFKNLEKSGMLESRKEGRNRFVKLNKNGRYFLNFYLRRKR